jgi:hypothetical protein
MRSAAELFIAPTLNKRFAQWISHTGSMQGTHLRMLLRLPDYITHGRFALLDDGSFRVWYTLMQPGAYEVLT